MQPCLRSPGSHRAHAGRWPGTPSGTAGRRVRGVIYEQMFTVQGVEAAIKKLDMNLGHANPLDSVY
eukprot:6309910-Lingulodinium_polyedra.AAC.1